MKISSLFYEIKPLTRVTAVSLLTCFLVTSAAAQLPSGDITLQPVINQNVPTYLSLSGYSISESSASAANKQLPMFYPYDSANDDWWDNLVAEQLQARLPVIMCASRGAWTLDPNDTTGPGNMNPRRLSKLMDAFGRANVSPSLMKVACFIDSPAMRGIYTNFYGLPGTTQMDLANQDGWEKIVWQRTMKPWFDTVPSTYWYRINNRPVIQFWGFHPSWCTNHYGNISQMLTYLADQFEATYGERPCFVMPEDVVTSSNQDATVTSQADVLGFNGWFSTPSDHWSTVEFLGTNIGCLVPGFIDPGFFNPASSNYQNYNRVISRNKVDGSGSIGDTLVEGLNAAMTSRAKYMLMEGWTDNEEWAGFYRSLDSNWLFPNQNINLIRQYSDLRTVTLRLEAEGADSYYDTTPGNSGGKFRRTGDLDVRDIAGGNGWQVESTAAGEWIQFRDVYFSPGNYKFPIRYASAGGATVRLSVDGVSLGNIVVSATGSLDQFNTISLGSKTLTGGKHTLRVQFVTGGVDLDWLFVRKIDPMISFQSSLNGKFVCAELGGNHTIIANRTAVGVWERFSADDTNGGLLSSGDVINLQSNNGMFLCAELGGGGALSVDRIRAGGWEKFTIIKTSGGFGALVNGDSVTLMSSNGQYLTTDTNGNLSVTGTTPGTAQTFSITLSAQ